MVDKANLDGIDARPHTALTDAVDESLRQATAFGHALGELVVGLHHVLLQLGVLELGEGLGYRAKVGVLVGFGHVEGETNLVVQEALGVGKGAKHADGAGEGGGIGKDVVALGRNPVTARSGVVAHRDDDGLHFLGQIKLATDDGRSYGTATRRVDAQHDGFHVLVFTRFADGLAEVLGIDVGGFIALAVEDLPRGVDDGHLVLAQALVFVGFGILGVADGVDALVASSEAFQLVKHLVFVIQIVDKAIFQGFLRIENGFQVVGDLVELCHADVAALADAGEDLSPNAA